MTIAMLEKMLTSEVENLHFRIDQRAEYVERIDERLSTVERQLGLLIMAIEELRVDLRTDYVTKSDLFALGEDLKYYVASLLGKA